MINISLILINLKYIIYIIIKLLIFFVPLLVSIAFLTLLERKVIGSMQQRKGPNVVGFFGLLQPIADGVKLVLKETMIPSISTTALFIIAPLITFSCAIALWGVIPLNLMVILADIDLSLLYILFLSSLSVYALIFAGWSSNSKYAFLGSLRSAAQMLSYEISMGLNLLNVVIFSGSFNILDIVESQNDIWYIYPLLPAFLLFGFSMLAETARTPFDLPEAEGELVAGYNVEYSGLTFALFFLGEYSNLIFMSFLCSLLFLGGWNFPGILTYGSSFFAEEDPIVFLSFLILTFKTLVILFFFLLIRATLPRFRYDRLMYIGWQYVLPYSLMFLIFSSTIYLLFLYI